MFHVCHVVLEESLLWVLDRNITRKFDIEHVRRHAMNFPVNGIIDSISPIDHKKLSYFSFPAFKHYDQSMSK